MLPSSKYGYIIIFYKHQLQCGFFFYIFPSNLIRVVAKGYFVTVWHPIAIKNYIVLRCIETSMPIQFGHVNCNYGSNVKYPSFEIYVFIKICFLKNLSKQV